MKLEMMSAVSYLSLIHISQVGTSGGVAHHHGDALELSAKVALGRRVIQKVVVKH